MTRFLRWLHIRLLCIQWGIRNAMNTEDGGGWVVVANRGTGEEWHAMGGGDSFGMDPETGRFQKRSDAQRFADMRNGEEKDGFLPGTRYSTTHETATFKPLPRRY